MRQILSRSSGSVRKPEDEHRATTTWGRRFTGDIATVCPRDATGDAQPQAGASACSIPSGVESDQAVEDPLPVGEAYAWSPIMHGDTHTARPPREHDPNCSPGWSDGAGVVQ